MKAVILAAGLGSRLKPLTDIAPKCLTEVNGKPILVNALEQIENLGISETILVVGYLKDVVKAAIGEKFGQMPIAYVENERYSTTNTSYSLLLALERASGERILVIEGDVFFAKHLLEEFVRDHHDNATVVEKYKPTLDGSFVEVEGGVVADWIHTSRRPPDFNVVTKYKTVNIHKFDARFVENVLRPTLKSHVDDSGGVEPFEYVLEDIVNNTAAKIYAFEAAGDKWFEIDDARDLAEAERIFARPPLDEVRSYHGGYWRYQHIDFHYLFNHYFPTEEFYAELARKLPTIGNYYPSSQIVLAQMLARWKDQDYWSAENLVAGNGSSELIRLLADHVVGRATVPLPTYNEFVRIPEGKLHTYLLDESRNFVLEPKRLVSEARRSQSDWVVIINPNNPVGYLTPLSDIEQVLQSGLNVIIDESFMFFAGAEYSAEQLVPQYKNLVVLASCTKSIGIAGLRLGYLLSSNGEVKKAVREHLPIWNINSITEYVIEALPRYRQEHADSIVRSVADTAWFFGHLQGISYLTPYPTHANAVFCKVQGSARRLAEILYDRYNLMVKEGLNQKIPTVGSYVRLGVRNRRDNEKLLAALREIDREKMLYEEVYSERTNFGSP